MPDFSTQLIDYCIKTKSKVIDLGGSKFTKVPEELLLCLWLEEINFSSSIELYDISLLSMFKKLKNLTLYRTKVIDLSPLSKLENLQNLSFPDTDVSDLSPLSRLKKIQKLNFSKTKVSDLSPLKELVNLERISCSETRISDLSPLQDMKNLRSLNCANTMVSNLYPILPLIRAGRNVLWEPYAHDILVTNCPLVHPPPEIVKKGNLAILNYFSERSKQQFKNTEIKLVLVGNSTSGKTSLSRFLRERIYVPTQHSTHGIQNYQWRPEGSDLQVNIWDFGGQEYYHATHRLFLSRNAVYTLVWDAMTDKTGIQAAQIYFHGDSVANTVQLEHFPIKWWLKNIRHFTSGSVRLVSIFLVQNKSALDGIHRVSNDFEAAPYNLRPEWIDNHIDIELAAKHKIDPKFETRKWQRAFEEFEERLIERLEHNLAKFEFAIYHRDIRDRVRTLASGENPVNEMPWVNFEAMCRDIEPDAKMDLVQIYLQDMTGDILYFDQNERLRHRVFLRPDWVCNRIYAILSRKVLERKGLFDLVWVREALLCDEREALDFVELMREFQIVFAENNENGEPTGNFIAPQYLPDICAKPDKLEAAKAYANLTHAFTLWFPEFLPKSHIARFVAHWGSKAKQRLFWKNGLLFQTEGCTTLVERLADEDKIRVEIQSECKNREAAMRHIFQSFLDLEDGQAGFAIAFDNVDFMLWSDIQEAIRSDAKKVKTFSLNTELKYVPLPHFFITTQQQEASMKHKIRALLQEAKTKEALELLVTVVPDASALLTTFNEAKRRNMLGALSFEAFSQKQSEVTLAALDMLGSLKDNHEPPVSTSSKASITEKVPNSAKKLFISYSKYDKDYLMTAKKHLKLFERQGELQVWDDTQLQPGDLWDAAIKRELANADIILFLVSADLLATDYIWDVEMTTAIARADAGAVKVVPVIIRDCSWTDAPFGKFNALPSKGTPIATLPDADTGWKEVVEKIRLIL